jgi:small subunit ribosomal protein S17e
LNKIRRLAEDLVTRYPSLFGPDFDKNKVALSQVTVVRTRSLRNQLAGAITKIIHVRGPLVTPSEGEPSTVEESRAESSELPTLEERAKIEGGSIPKLSDESGSKIEKSGSEESMSKTAEHEVAESSPITG